MAMAPQGVGGSASRRWGVLEVLVVVAVLPWVDGVGWGARAREVPGVIGEAGSPSAKQHGHPLVELRGGVLARRRRGMQRRLLDPSKRGLLKRVRIAFGAFFASLFNPFYGIDMADHPDAGQGFIVSSSSSSSSSPGSRGGGHRGAGNRGERGMYSTDRKGKRRALRVKTLADMPRAAG
eukprot:CAMPEP_0118974254 /NCGR_PEP_ID=MMETSP1173-20130426/11152_1 /TAXON_ID=1034831 /ORGANISM="Rhizochromulina marina cf, Strain CCMP1243" /LENGTH=178 /DNA_ID=CAMNT_0006923967 /DNA_START=11 /DNA_END=547 /DNA_ORIENTATION=-